MGKLKISSNQFLESQELRKLIDFIDDNGFRKLFKGLTKNFGLLQKYEDLGGNKSFEVISYNATSIKVRGDSTAFDSNGKTIYLKDDVIQNIPIDATNSYWFKISHTTSNLEDGTITIDTQGNLTGVDTLFTNVLRGQPNFPTKITVYSEGIYEGEFEVLKVISDTQAILQGDFSGGGYSDVQYAVIGTFDYSATIEDENKKIYEYDSCNLEVITAETQPLLSANEEFLIAKVTNFAGSIVITDLREDHLLTLTDIIDNDNYALINRENIFEDVIGNVVQNVDTGNSPGLSKGYNIILEDVSSSIINLDASGITNSSCRGFWKADNEPFTVGSVLTIRNVADQTITFTKSSTVNAINCGFVDYAPWLYSDDDVQNGTQIRQRILRKNQIVTVVCASNSFDNVDGVWRSLWIVLDNTAEDMYQIWNKIKQVISDVEVAPAKVFVNGDDGITDTDSADAAGAKEGDIWIS